MNIQLIPREVRDMDAVLAFIMLVGVAVGTALLGFFVVLYRPAVSAAIADLVPPEGRPRAYGYLYWAINLGAAVAPVIAGLMAQRAYLLLFIGDAVTTFVFGLIVMAGVPESRPAQAAQSNRESIRMRLNVLRREPLLLAFTVLALLFGTVYMQAHVTLPVEMQSHGLTPTDYGLAVAVNGALIVVLGLPASHSAARWPRFPALAAAGVLLGVGFGLNAVATTLPTYALAVVIWTLGEILGATVAPSVVADLAPVAYRCGLGPGLFHRPVAGRLGIRPLRAGRVVGDVLPSWIGAGDRIPGHGSSGTAEDGRRGARGVGSG